MPPSQRFVIGRSYSSPYRSMRPEAMSATGTTDLCEDSISSARISKTWAPLADHGLPRGRPVRPSPLSEARHAAVHRKRRSRGGGEFDLVVAQVSDRQEFRRASPHASDETDTARAC